MRIPQIQIRQGYAKIDLSIQKATVEIEQPPAELNLTQKPAEMTIDRTPSSIEVDTTEARANIDMKSIARRNEEFANLSQQDVLEGISRRAEEGDRMGAIENKADSIAQLAKDQLFQEKELYKLSYNPNYMTIRYNPSQIKIDWKINGASADPVIHKPNINYSPGKVTTFIAQRNWIDISI